jgi:putative membrane protein
LSQYFSKKIKLFFKGVAMGTADLMPGISGGTIALILGVYQELIQSIDAINLQNLKSFKKQGLKSFWKNINGPFLFPLFSGILTAIFGLAFVIDWLISHHPIPLWSFFLGLLLASIVMLKNRLSHWHTSHLILLLAGALFSFTLSQITPGEGQIGLVYLFFCGMIGIVAMILPGISGAYILLILGAYSTLIGLIKSLITSFKNPEWDVLLPVLSKLLVFVLGALIGLRVFASILKWLFEKQHDKTMAVLMGLMFGALYKIWPWQEKRTLVFEHKTKILSHPVSPFDYPENPQILLAVVLFLSGIILVWILERIK